MEKLIILLRQSYYMIFNTIGTHMNFRWLPKISLQASLSVLLGALVFFLITGGGKILWPTYINWLYEGDSTTHWLGWQYFRYTPMDQWPIGANLDYGMDIGSSIVFTDSVSLMAFIFKPFSALLPDAFQYSGLWILICFVLQSFFAWKLLSLVTKDKWLPIIGSVFFTIAPASLWRLQYHYALFAHWVLLAALYLYFVKSFSAMRWIALLGATALIEPYLLAMTIAIWMADVSQRRFLKQSSNIETLRNFAVVGISTIFIMWAAGYFMLGDSVGASGFGYLRVNLLSLIDPDNMWSKLLRDQKGGGGDYEGFSYLGLGMLLLGFIAIYEFLRNYRFSYKPRIIPILIVSIILFLYAVSNHVGFGAHELFTYNIPSIFKKLTTSFRTSGRFFWPVYYLIYLAIFYLLFTRLNNRVAIILCVVMLSIQIADSANAWRYFKQKFANAPACVSPMASPVWNDMAHQYKKIIWVNLPRNSRVGWFPLCQFSATHRMAINFGYFGRSDPLKMEESAAKLEASIVNNELDPDALYIFEDNALWNIASNQVSPSDVAGILDGFKIVAPNLKSCRDCNQREIANISVGQSNHLDYKMERIAFTPTGTGKSYQLFGWQDSEDWGTWSVGKTALVLFTLTDVPKNDINLLIDGHAFLGKKPLTQEIDVLVNNHHLATLKYDQQSNIGERVIKIPNALVLEKNGQLLIKFDFKNPISQLDVGESGDTRLRGLGIVSLKLTIAN